MAKPVTLDVQEGSWEHAVFLYPDINLEEPHGVAFLRVKNHTAGMRLYSWLTIVLPRWLHQNDDELRGFNFRQKPDEWLLIVKVTAEGIPLVAFTSGSHPMDCIRLFRMRVCAAGAIWYPDKYA